MESYNMMELIPQRPPMVMIDLLNDWEEQKASGSLFVKEENLFSFNGIFLEAGMVEFMAQTAAAYTGYKKKTGKEEVSEGYIGGIKNLNIHRLPPVGSLLTSEIIIENEIAGYTIITGRVLLHGEVLASCEMRILTAVD